MTLDPSYNQFLSSTSQEGCIFSPGRPGPSQYEDKFLNKWYIQPLLIVWHKLGPMKIFAKRDLTYIWHKYEEGSCDPLTAGIAICTLGSL